MGEWIGQILFDDSVAAKITMKHSLTPDQVREAVCWGAAEAAVWDEDPDLGARLFVFGRTSDGTSIKAVLLPVDRTDGTWRCKTAMRATR